MPILALEWKLSPSALGIMATTTSIITSFLQPVFGHMVDKYRRSWMLPISVVWTAVGTCVIGFFPSFLMIIVLSVIGGMGGSFYHPIGSQYTTSIAKQKTAYEMRISDWSSDVCSSDLMWPNTGWRNEVIIEVVVAIMPKALGDSFHSSARIGTIEIRIFK